MATVKASAKRTDPAAPVQPRQKRIRRAHRITSPPPEVDAESDTSALTEPGDGDVDMDEYSEAVATAAHDNTDLVHAGSPGHVEPLTITLRARPALTQKEPLLQAVHATPKTPPSRAGALPLTPPATPSPAVALVPATSTESAASAASATLAPDPNAVATIPNAPPQPQQAAKEIPRATPVLTGSATIQSATSAEALAVPHPHPAQNLLVMVEGSVPVAAAPAALASGLQAPTGFLPVHPTQAGIAAVEHTVGEPAGHLAPAAQILARTNTTDQALTQSQPQATLQMVVPGVVTSLVHPAELQEAINRATAAGLTNPRVIYATVEQIERFIAIHGYTDVARNTYPLRMLPHDAAWGFPTPFSDFSSTLCARGTSRAMVLNVVGEISRLSLAGPVGQAIPRATLHVLPLDPAVRAAAEQQVTTLSNPQDYGKTIDLLGSRTDSGHDLDLRPSHFTRIYDARDRLRAKSAMTSLPSSALRIHDIVMMELRIRRYRVPNPTANGPAQQGRPSTATAAGWNTWSAYHELVAINLLQSAPADLPATPAIGDDVEDVTEGMNL
ncbi:hypothetical protein C8R44DRAFT_731724 [Mycena epipterygia]|nr:hypothetical protein C8R44DRAFT_731724 [Mycena epipterygia]